MSNLNTIGPADINAVLETDIQQSVAEFDASLLQGPDSQIVNASLDFIDDRNDQSQGKICRFIPAGLYVSTDDRTHLRLNRSTSSLRASKSDTIKDQFRFFSGKYWRRSHYGEPLFLKRTNNSDSEREVPFGLIFLEDKELEAGMFSSRLTKLAVVADRTRFMQESGFSIDLVRKYFNGGAISRNQNNLSSLGVPVNSMFDGSVFEDYVFDMNVLATELELSYLDHNQGILDSSLRFIYNFSESRYERHISNSYIDEKILPNSYFLDAVYRYLDSPAVNKIVTIDGLITDNQLANYYKSWLQFYGILLPSEYAIGAGSLNPFNNPNSEKVKKVKDFALNKMGHIIFGDSYFRSALPVIENIARMAPMYAEMIFESSSPNTLAQNLQSGGLMDNVVVDVARDCIKDARSPYQHQRETLYRFLDEINPSGNKTITVSKEAARVWDLEEWWRLISGQSFPTQQVFAEGQIFEPIVAPSTATIIEQQTFPEGQIFDPIVAPVSASTITTTSSEPVFSEGQTFEPIVSQPTATMQQTFPEGQIFEPLVLPPSASLVTAPFSPIPAAPDVEELGIFIGSFEDNRPSAALSPEELTRQRSPVDLSSQFLGRQRDPGFFQPIETSDLFTLSFDMGMLQRVEATVWFTSAVRRLVRQHTRTFREILEGKKAHSETLMYRISKHSVDSNGDYSEAPIQEFYVPNTPELNLVKFVDAQVKFGKKYKYVIHAFQAVVGTRYQYVDDKGDPLFKIDFGSTGPAKLFGPQGVGVFWVAQEPSVKLVEVSFAEFEIGMIQDRPPMPPDVRFIPYKSDSSRIRLSLNSSTGELWSKPIEIEEDDAERVNQYSTIPFVKEDKVLFRSDDELESFHVYRTEVLPESYRDFRGKMVEVSLVEGLGSPVPLNSIGVNSKIELNTKYYYTFRAVDRRGNRSNPTAVYEVEMVGDENSYFLLVREVEMRKKKIGEKTKTVKRMLALAAAFDHSVINKQKSGIENELTLLSNQSLFLGTETSTIWNRKFKFRFTSKKTGRKIDINVSMKYTTRGMVFEYSSGENIIIADTFSEALINLLFDQTSELM